MACADDAASSLVLRSTTLDGPNDVRLYAQSAVVALALNVVLYSWVPPYGTNDIVLTRLTNNVCATASAALSPFDVSAAASVQIGATASAALSPFAVAALGDEVITGSVNAALSPFAATATAQTQNSGSVNAALAPFAVAAAGALSNTGAASSALSPFDVTVLGESVVTGSASAAFTPFDALATALTTLSGSVNAALSPFAVAALGLSGANPPPFCRGLAEFKFVVSLVDPIEKFALAFPVNVLAQATVPVQVALALNTPSIAVVDAPQIRTIVISC